jgi:hypothetical protein
MYVGTKHPVFSSGREETPYPRLEGERGPGTPQLLARGPRHKVHIMPCIIPQTHATMETLQKQENKGQNTSVGEEQVFFVRVTFKHRTP